MLHMILILPFENLFVLAKQTVQRFSVKIHNSIIPCFIILTRGLNVFRLHLLFIILFLLVVNGRLRPV